MNFSFGKLNWVFWSIFWHLQEKQFIISMICRLIYHENNCYKQMKIRHESL